MGPSIRRPIGMAGHLAGLFLLVCAGVDQASGQSITGTLFHDVDRDGLHDPGEPVLSGRSVELFGAGGSVDQIQTTDASGRFVFAPPGSADYVLSVQQGLGWRLSFAELGGDPDPIPDFPAGRPRVGDLDHLLEHLRMASGASPLLHVGMGDSIAFGFNVCDSLFGQNGYLEPYTARLGGVGLAADLDKIAVPGLETSDVLIPGGGGDLFMALALAPDLVTISLAGNDFLGDDGNEAATAGNLVRARQNLQEILSTLLSELPQCDVTLNTIYDNVEGANPFHNRWGGIWNQMLRDLAFGQVRRVGVTEVWPEYAHRDPATGQILGERDLICDSFLDGIHPLARGYTVHREKLWQASGGVALGAGEDAEVALGFLESMETRFPTQFLDLAGGVINEALALDLDDVGALVPAGAEELRLSGFDSTARGLLTQAVVHVRYRTTAAPVDDVYRMEASVEGTFAPPGADATSWNSIQPIVGGAGNSGAEVLAFADQPVYRTVSTLLTQGSPEDGQPTLSWQDLADLSVRIQGLPQGAADAFDVEWDAAWLELYGIPPLRLLVRGDGTVGSSLQIDATGVQGSLCLLFVALAPGSVPFPGFGTLLLDPTTLTVLFTGLVGQRGACTLAGPVPVAPDLSGVTLYFQALLVEDLATRTGGLTNRAEITFP